ncbi:MAG: class I lanthipeptide [Hyphomicrobiales bacterium]
MKKLSFKKETIARLDDGHMNNVLGGRATYLKCAIVSKYGDCAYTEGCNNDTRYCPSINMICNNYTEQDPCLTLP